MTSRSLPILPLTLIILCAVSAGLSGCAGDSISLDNSASGLAVVSNPSAIDGTAGVPYAGGGGVVFTVSGGLPGAEYYWTTTDLPPGLSRTPRDNQTPSATLVFSGTPSCSGANTVKVTVHTSPEHNILIPGQDFVIPIAGDSPFLEISPSTVLWPGALVPQTPANPQPYRRTLSVCGGQGPYSWSVASVPAGVSFDPSSGTFSQSATSSPGKVPVAVTLVDGKGRTLQKTVTLWVISIADFKGQWTGVITQGVLFKRGTTDVEDELTGHRVSILLDDQGVLLQGSMHDRIVEPHNTATDPAFNFGLDYPTQLGGYLFQFPWHLDCVPVELDSGTIDCIAHYQSPNPTSNDAVFRLTRVSTETSKDTTAPAVSAATFTPNPQDATAGQETVTFSEPVSSGAAIRLAGGSGSAGPVAFSDDGTTATIPLTGLAPQTAYTLTLNPADQPAGRPGFLDRAGNALALTQRTFTTASNTTNQTPIAIGQSVSMVHDRTLTIDLLATDDGSVLTYATTNPLHGTLSGTGSSRLYTPTAGYVGFDSFSFSVTDSGGLTASAFVDITITNLGPTATPQSVGAQLGVARSITLAGTDPDGDSLTFTIATQPTNGTLSGTPPGMTYTGNTVGTYSFTFRVSDGLTPSAAATVNINVTASNQAPTATPQSVSTVHGQSKVITLTGSDPEGGALTYAIVTPPTQGTLSGSGATRTYTPTSGTYIGPDSFTFKVTDPGSLESAPATVSINMTNQTPTATAQNVTVVYNTPKPITLAGSDSDGDSLTFAIVGPLPVNGTLSGSGASVTYTPTSGYSGADSFTFTASDGIGTSAPATVSITVTTPNQPPTATPQSVSTPHGQAKAITLAGIDPEGGALTYNIVTLPSQGTLSGSGGSRTYTPTSTTYVGLDSFTFTVTDPVGQVSAPATVSITVTDQPPAATAQSVTVTTDTPKTISLAGTDSDGDSLTFAIAGSPTHGSLSSISGSSVTYTPNPGYTGSDSFTFTASDGIATSAPATVGLTVVTGNQVPVANSQTVKDILTRQFNTSPTYVYFYAITLTGSDAEDGTLSPPLHFKITDFPDTWDSTRTMGMVAGNQYRRWNGAGWEIFTATTSTTVDPVTGDITVDPPGSPVTIIYTPPACHFDPRLATSMQFTVTDSTGQVSTPGTVGINIKFLFCNHPG